MTPGEAEVQRTWDGLAIADDLPIGSTVCVRRTLPGGTRQVLLLHRASQGPEYAGDWAWTCPAGCRQPGEPVYPAALRELAEEAGLSGLHPWPVDLSGEWALFAVDVEVEQDVTLVDPEHDRFAWVSPDVVRQRVLPGFVGVQQAEAAVAPVVDVRIRPVAGRSEEDGRRWDVTIDGGVAAALRVAPASPVGAVVVEVLIDQVAPVREAALTRVLWDVCRDVARLHPRAAQVVVQPSSAEVELAGALVRCGFAAAGGGYILDVRHWLG